MHRPVSWWKNELRGETDGSRYAKVEQNMATVCGLQLLCGLAKRVGNTRVAVMIYVLQGNEVENDGWQKANSCINST